MHAFVVGAVTIPEQNGVIFDLNSGTALSAAVSMRRRVMRSREDVRPVWRGAVAEKAIRL